MFFTRSAPTLLTAQQPNNGSTVYTFTEDQDLSILVVFGNTDGNWNPTVSVSNSSDLTLTQLGTSLSSSGRYFKHYYAAYLVSNAKAGSTLTITNASNTEKVFAIYGIS